MVEIIYGLLEMRKLVIAISAVFLAFSSNVFAAENSPYIEGQFGASMPRDNDLSGVDTGQAFTAEGKFKESLNFGGEIGVANIGGTGFRVAASTSYFKMRLDEVCGAGGCAADNTKLDYQSYFGKLYYDFASGSPLTPFVGIAVGMVDVEDIGSDPAWGGSVGVNYNVTDNVYVGVRGDYLYSYSRHTEIDGAESTTNDDFEVFSASVVLGFKF